MKAMIVVDVQKDFLPGGPLGVPGGDEIVPVVNRLMEDYDYVVTTRDWHPPTHGSFAVNHPGKKEYELGELAGLPQVMWPVHCVENSAGAEYAEGLDIQRIDADFPKGTRAEIDSYSGFYDNGGKNPTGLAEWLRDRNITDVAVCGLALDYCVKFTALDAIKEGFRVSVLPEASRGVDLTPGDCENAIAEMRKAGVEIVGGNSDPSLF